MDKFIFRIYCFVLSLFIIPCFADNNNMKIFPIEHYSQNIEKWLNPSEPNYEKNLLSKDYQEKRLKELTHTYFGTHAQDNSVWSSHYVTYILHYNNNLPYIIQGALNRFDNQLQSKNQQVYGMNYRIYKDEWLSKIRKNIDLSTFSQLHYQQENRAIASQNLPLRVIPTDDPGYYSTHIAGEGYPFDNIQSSALYVGTPLYILGSTRDKAWLLVITPECIGWVKSMGVARVNNQFIQQWQQAAYEKLSGIKRANISVYNETGQHQFYASVGMLFPQISSSTILIPVKQANGYASIEKGITAAENIILLPWSASPEHFAEIFSILKGREYGWGGLNFYNDCSAEMKAIFSLFGIFMPRNTQSQILAGYMKDISSLSNVERSEYLMSKGSPLLTLVHVKGHILLYIGTYKDKKGKAFPLSYQQVWSLYPKDKSSRSVIGQAVFLPLLTHYPEDTHLAPQLDNELFQVVYLNQFPEKTLKQNLTL